MNPIIEKQLAAVQKYYPEASATLLQGGAHLIEIPNVELPHGWDRKSTKILFLAPPGYPAAQPDCFWVEPGQIRLINGFTPQASNDSNPIPGVDPTRQLTWFSWHLQSWNPNTNSLYTYLTVILNRFESRQ